MSAKKKLMKFLQQAQNAPEGCRFEVGLVYDVKDGWRVYERIHEAALFMSPKQTRAIADTYDKMAKRAEWKRASEGLAWVPVELRKLADECEQKNKAGSVPDGYAEIMPTAGRA